MKSGGHDGSNRHDYFQGVRHGYDRQRLATAAIRVREGGQRDFVAAT
jgi:hypothetical protein